MNKLKVLSLIPALILCSCAKGATKNKYVGTYQFRLGKSDGNHMEVTAVITDDNDPKVEGYKVMTLSADLGDQFSISKQIEELEEMIDDLVEELKNEGIEDLLLDIDTLIDSLPKLVTSIKDEINALDKIPFFYKVSNNKHEKYGNRLELGTHAFADIFAKLEAKHPEIEDLFEAFKGLLGLTGFFESDLTVMPDKARYAFNGFIGKKGLTFQVPVSKDDLNYQLMWYGFENNLFSDVTLPPNYVSKMPGTQGDGRFGTHPAKEVKNNKVIKDEAKQVNEIFAYEFSNSPLFDKDEPELHIARFVLDSEAEQSKLIMKWDTDAVKKGAGTYEGIVKIDSTPKAISLTVDDNGVCQVEHNGKKGLKEGFFDNNHEEFRFRDVVTDPFTFRDFNIVDVGLAKVEA